MTTGTEPRAGTNDLATEQLAAVLRGTLVRPGDARYDEARAVFNRMIDRRPALVVRCEGAGDVVAAVAFARERGLPLSVRGGAHSVAGHSTCDGGVVIDLSPMRGITVDRRTGRVRAQAGLKLRDLDAELQAFGLAVPLGIVSDTGIAGLTLGGGIGWLNGRYGLACDNVLTVDIVTADGELRRASADEHPDLFWAVRGGSGNFGVVTAFEYQAHPIGPTVTAGPVFYPVGRAREVLRFYREFAAGCPDELSTMAALLTGPDGSPLVGIVVCHCGTPAEAETALRPLRSLGTPLVDGIAPTPFRLVQGMLDGAFPPGNQHYWKSNFVRRLTDEAIDVMIDGALSRPSPLSIVALQQMHGAAARVSSDATAFSHRAEQFDFLILAQWSGSDEAERNVRWARGVWEAMQPHAETGVYVNNLGDEGEDRARAAYGDNYERLVAVKHAYDPENLFRLNQNIRPAD